MKSKLTLLVTSSALLGSLLIVGVASAQTTTPPLSGSQGGHWGMGTGSRMPGVFGTVSAINGTTLTVTSKGFGQNATATTYTVDASNATVSKAGASSSVSAIAVGDTVMVQGTVSGDSVTATSIRDGAMPGGPGMGQNIIQGNGEPVVGGTVTAISGSTVTITNKSNVTYTIDVSSATVEKDNATSSVPAIAVGDNVVVQGTVNGTSVTASSVIDSGVSTGTSSSGGMSDISHRLSGFMGAIGGFFQHLFGFF